jgi:chromate reductase, NAD(P)H dehydrogenase (quinone)
VAKTRVARNIPWHDVRMKILGIAGSLRSTSSNAALVRAAPRVFSGIELTLFEGLGALPHFSPDLDVEPLPDTVRELRALIASHDALLICTPEYAHGMPGSLKNALDWLVSAVEAVAKPVVLVGASPGGAAHAHAQLSEVLRTMSMKVIDGGTHVFSRSKLGSAGEVTDPQLLAALQRAFGELQAVITTLQQE